MYNLQLFTHVFNKVVKNGEKMRLLVVLNEKCYSWW